MLKNHTGPPQYYSVKLLQSITNSHLFLGYSHDYFFKANIQGKVVLNLFFEMFSGSLPISHGYFSP